MGISLDGLASGLDTTALINALMSVEAIPQQQLQSKVSVSQNLTNTLQSLNTKIAALADLAKGTAKAGALDIYKATSSSETVTAMAAAAATAGEVDFVVTQTAQKHSAVSAAMVGWPDDPPILILTASDGTRTEVDAASASLDDVAAAVSASGTGVTAMKVAAGTDPDTGATFYRLQFTAGFSGAESVFQIHRKMIDGTEVDLFAEPGAAIVRQGQDATVKMYAGTAAEQTVTSATNMFEDLIPGVSVTVTEASADPVTISVARDDAAVGTKAEELVTALKGIFDFIKSKSGVSTSANSIGTTTTRGGVLLGDSTVRMVEREIMAAATAPVNGRSPSEVGIEITKDGTIKFDAERLAKALADDPAHVETTLQTIAGRVDAAAVNASDKYEGLITSKIKGQESLVSSLNDQILNWDKRLAAREATLMRVYSSLEVLMSNMNSQMSWLSSQLASLPTSASSNK